MRGKSKAGLVFFGKGTRFLREMSKGTAGEWDRIQDEQNKAKESTGHWNGQEAENGNKSTRQGCG